MNPRNALKIVSLLIAIAAAFLVLDRIELPYDDLFWRSVQNSGHAPFFGLLALLFLALSVSVLGKRVRSHADHYVIAGVLATLGGVASEVAQILGPRDADIWDLMRDVAGIIFFLTIVSLFDGRMIEFWKKRPRGMKSVSVVVALALFVAVWVPVVSWGIASWQRSQTFPVICDFESKWTRKYISSRDAKLEVAAPPAGWKENRSGHVASVTFGTVKYPTLFVDEPLSDWQTYERLIFEVFLPEAVPVNLFVTVQDVHHDMEYEDRFNRMIVIEPGYNRVEIPLTEIENAPQGRTMDMSAIGSIRLFVAHPSEAITLYFDNFRLE